ncbi:hypothetical protein G7Y89_g3770 [Cudoniella acicularis]|uniref:Nucleoside phosphorylase domain-containing protein n=1 Tax=Cudoniella acicularis TaxID=354080 RepID=A0A8H4RQR0_9HELO|nr:hypothetical protein G7Y89_g3770 [Cudoniella acicularis]
MGKATQDGFERTGALNNPPTALLTALGKLETAHELSGTKIPQYLDEIKVKWPKLAQNYLRSSSLEDVLFRADYDHVSKHRLAQKLTQTYSRSDSSENVLLRADYDHVDETSADYAEEKEEEESCKFCDRTKIIKRKPRDMRVHYGTIASGNQKIKHAAFRSRLNKDLGGGVLCIDTEAAGFMSCFPCVVIRGISHYADSHKNKDWEEHVAAVAAAFAKELLSIVAPEDVGGDPGQWQVTDMTSRRQTELHGQTNISTPVFCYGRYDPSNPEQTNGSGANLSMISNSSGTITTLSGFSSRKEIAHGSVEGAEGSREDIKRV